MANTSSIVGTVVVLLRTSSFNPPLAREPGLRLEPLRHLATVGNPAKCRSCRTSNGSPPLVHHGNIPMLPASDWSIAPRPSVAVGVQRGARVDRVHALPGLCGRRVGHPMALVRSLPLPPSRVPPCDVLDIPWR
eukprot:1060844-Prorocentrum_minimum.AAC.5